MRGHAVVKGVFSPGPFEGDIVVTGSDLPAGDIAVEFAGNLAGTDITKMTVSDTSGMDAGIVSVAETTKGSDGWIHRNSNNINDALEGVTLNLHDVTPEDEPIQVTIGRNTATISKQIQAMVAAYNDLMDNLKTNTEYDDETKKMGILSRDVAAALLKSQSRRVNRMKRTIN